MAGDDDFGALFEESLAADDSRGSKRVRRGQVVLGTVVSITDAAIFVDVGAKSEAYIDRHELLDKDGSVKVNIGDPIRATVASTGREGTRLVVALGRGGVDTAALELALESGTPIEATVSAAVKAGLEVDVGGVRAFCPASQVDVGYTENLEHFVGQRHFFKVLEVRDRGRSIVVSRRAVIEQEREAQAEDLLRRLEPGVEVDGIVHSIKPYGVFVDLGGVHGLVHVSELSHGRVSRPDDLLSIGEEVRAKVLSVERPESGKARDLKISLSLKAMSGAPPVKQSSPEEVVTATVSRVESFGVFVDTPAGGGLVPTRELGLPAGGDPRRAFPVGTEVDVVMTGRDAQGKLKFSVKGVEEAEQRRAFRSFKEDSKSQSSLGSLGDLMRGKIDLPDGPSATADGPKKQGRRRKA